MIVKDSASRRLGVTLCRIPVRSVLERASWLIAAGTRHGFENIQRGETEETACSYSAMTNANYHRKGFQAL